MGAVRNPLTGIALALGALVALIGVGSALGGSPAKTRLVSKTSSGAPATGGDVAISASGRYLAFASSGDNLPGDDTVVNVYVHDRKTQKTRLVSKTSAGAPATGGNSELPAISGSGRRVAFQSDAANLPAGCSGYFQAYVHDRKTGKTRLVSRTSAGEPGGGNSAEPSISASGRFVAFDSGAPNLPGGEPDSIYVHDLKSRKTRLISKTSSGEPATGGSSFYPSLSASGRYVAFDSAATNLPGDDTIRDVFLHDRKTGNTRLVSRTSAGVPADGQSDDASISATGRFVAYDSSAENLPGDVAGTDVYVFDRKRGRTTLVSKNSSGEQADSTAAGVSISASGRFVAFQTPAENFPGAPATTDVYVRNRKSGRVKLVSQTSTGEPADASSFLPAISASARFVAFGSLATNLPGGPNNIYVRGPLR